MKLNASLSRAWRRAHLVVIIGLLLVMVGWHAEPVRAAPPVAVFPADIYSAFTIFKGDPAPTKEIISVAGQSFDTAMRLRTLAAPDGPPYAMGISGLNSVTISKGDVLFASFWARAVEPVGGMASSQFNFELADTPYTKSYGMPINVDANWRQYQFSFYSAGDYAPGTAQISFWLGYEPQVIDIGGLSLLNYFDGVGVPVARGYEGREANAPWRAAAAARIDQLRKGDLTVVVRDQQGNPIPNAAVQVDMTRHAFPFGSAVDATRLRESSSDGQIYRSKVRQLFNNVVFESDMKWPGWEDRALREETTLPALLWLRQQGISVRGHNLVWPSWIYLPPDLYELRNDPTALRNRVDTHIDETTSALRGYLTDWDVINEPYSEHDLMDILGDAEMIRWFEQSYAGDPQAKRFINDYDILEQGGEDLLHQNHYYDTINYLLSNGAPLDGIGIQGHFGQNLTSPTKLLEILDRFGAFNRPIRVTEFDINIIDEQLQADYTRDFMTVLFSHPQVDGFLMWGFWEGQHWRPDGAMFRQDWSPKPNALAYQDLVFNQWWTNVAGVTDANGSYSVRGFQGDYRVQVTVNGVSNTLTTSLPGAGQTLVVTFDPAGGLVIAPPAEQLLNGSFEDELKAWFDLGNSALTGDASSGTRALQLGPGAGGVAQRVIDIVPNSVYNLSATAKLSRLANHCFVGVRGGSIDGVATFSHSLHWGNDRAYTQQELPFNVPGGTTWLEIFAWKNSSANNVTCIVDNLSLTPTSGSPATPPLPPVAPTAPSAARNLLGSGGLEDNPKRWFNFGPSQITVVSSPTHSGSKALLVSNRSDYWQGAGQSVTEGMHNNYNYQSEAWVRLVDGAGAATGQITLKLVTTSETVSVNLGSAQISDSNWTKISGVGGVQWSGTLQRAEWFVSTASGTASFLIDDADLRIVAPPAALVAGDQLFENGAAEDGTTNWFAFSPATLTSVSSPVHGGTGALLLSNRTEYWQAVAQNVTAKISSGYSYRSSVWVRLTDGSPSATVNVTLKIVSAGGTQLLSFGSANVSASGWTQISGTLTPTWTGSAQLEWFVSTASGTASFLIDNASLTQTFSAVSPVLECVAQASNGSYIAYFGYNNPNSFTVGIPVGTQNRFSPAPQDRGQATQFAPGRVYGSFKVPFWGNNLVWTLNGRTATASAQSAACSP
jgi:GH35 family endo-1,4-beta-xylanase